MLEQNTDRSIHMVGVILLAGAIMLVILGFVPDVISSLASTADGVDVVYELDGGSSKMEKRHLGLKGEHTIPLEEPIKEIYHFAGWENSTTGEIQFPGETFTPKQDTTMVATWRVRQHDIEYDVNGGEGEYPLQRVDLSNTYKLYPNEPVLDGHTFRGWHNSHTGGTNYPNQTITPDGDILFTANWTLDSYPVTYHLNSGSGSFANTEIDHFAQFNISNTKPTRTGYTFTGWLVESDDPAVSNVTKQPGQSIEITGRTRLTAQWSTNSYNITYDLNGGVGTSTGSTVVYSNSYKPHTTAPTRVGYTFQGWKRSDTGTVINPGATFTMPANNVKLTAQWTINSYKVTYSLNGGSGSFSQGTHNYSALHTVSSTKPTRTGYTFAGWRRSDNSAIVQAGGSFTMPNRNITLTAEWTANTYKISYSLNGGASPSATTTHVFGTLATVSGVQPNRIGHKFDGWKRSDTGAIVQPGVKITMPANNITMTAQWSINKHTISYSLNGGSGSFGPQTFNFDDYAKIHTTTPTRTNYTFAGWRRGDNSAIVQVGGSFTMPDRNITLTAQWSVARRAITFNANGGTGAPSPTTVSHNTQTRFQFKNPTRSGYTFEGWKRPDGSIVNIGGYVVVIKDESWVAQWVKNTPATISFDLNGGVLSIINRDKFDPVTVMTGDRYSPPYAQPTRKDYHFDGWQRPNGSVLGQYAGFDVTGSETLTAKWTRYEYVYAMIARDGEPTESVRLDMTSPTYGRITVRTPLGYVWRDRATGITYEDGDTFSTNKTVIFDEIKR